MTETAMALPFYQRIRQRALNKKGDAMQHLLFVLLA